MKQLFISPESIFLGNRWQVGNSIDLISGIFLMSRRHSLAVRRWCRHFLKHARLHPSPGLEQTGRVSVTGPGPGRAIHIPGLIIPAPSPCLHPAPSPLS